MRSFFFFFLFKMIPPHSPKTLEPVLRLHVDVRTHPCLDKGIALKHRLQGDGTRWTRTTN